MLWNSRSGGEEGDVRNPTVLDAGRDSSSKQTSNEAFLGCYGVQSSMARGVAAYSQSRQIEWRGGGRNMLTQRQIAGGSGHKPGGAGHRK